MVLHVGIYDTNNQFIHASTSKGVMRSSLDNVYWQKNLAGETNLSMSKMDGDDTSPSIYPEYSSILQTKNSVNGFFVYNQDNLKKRTLKSG